LERKVRDAKFWLCSAREGISECVLGKAESHLKNYLGLSGGPPEGHLLLKGLWVAVGESI